MAALSLSYMAAKALLVLCGGQEGAFSRSLLMQAGGLSALLEVISYPFDPRRVIEGGATSEEGDHGVLGVACVAGGVLRVQRVELWMSCVECLTCLMREGACQVSALSSPRLVDALKVSSPSPRLLPARLLATQQPSVHRPFLLGTKDASYASLPPFWPLWLHAHHQVD